MRQDAAEIIALQALSWLATDEEMLHHFCAATGTDPASLAQAAHDPEFLAGVLDFVIMDDEWVEAFSRAAGVAPNAPLEARAALPGGTAPDWT